MSSAGGIPTPVTVLDRTRGETTHSFPAFLPDQHHFIYFRAAADKSAVYSGSLDAKPSEQPMKRLIETRNGGLYAPPSGSWPGSILFLRDGTHMVQPFDEKELDVTGEPIPAAEQVGGSAYYGSFSVSPNGVLVYRRGSTSTSAHLV